MDVAEDKPQFAETGRPRSEVVTLEWPINFGGKLYEAICVSRMTAAQVDEFVEAVKAKGPKTSLPMFDAPPEVIEALDADDANRVNEVVSRFLPRALLPAE